MVFAFSLLGVAAYFAAHFLGLESVTGVPMSLWPREAPGEAERLIVGAAMFLVAASVLGMLVRLALPRKKARREKYPSSLGELDSYTGFLSDE